MALLNKFGKKKWKKNYSSSALNAGKVWNIQPSDEEVEQYGPFTHAVIFNYNTSVTVEVRLNSTGLGDDSLQGGDFVAFILPSAALEIEDKDGFLFTRIAIKNKDAATNMSAGDLQVRIQNY